MNEFKGTPGPWEVDGVEIRASASHPTERLCEMAPGFSKADAQLIAAAPDLLAALQEIYRHGVQAFGEDFEVMLEAKAAIAKATSISN